MNFQETEYLQIIEKRFEELGLMPVFRSHWKILPITEETQIQENWEEAWAILIHWVRDTYFHRLDPDRFEIAINDLMDNEDYKEASAICSTQGHDWVSDDEAGLESWYMGQTCQRCGLLHGTQLY